MAQFKSFVSNVKNIWQTPEQAVYAEEDINNAFEAEEIKNAAPSTDTLSAENITNGYTVNFVNDTLAEDSFATTKATANANTKATTNATNTTASNTGASNTNTNKLYGNNSYNGDGYEDLTDPTFTVARTAKGDEAVETVPEYEETAVKTVASEKKYTNYSFIQTGDLFGGSANTAKATSNASNTTFFSSAIKFGSINFDAPGANAAKAEAPKAEATRTEAPKAEADTTNTVKASVGYNTASTAAGTSSYSASKIAGGRTMADRYSVQVLRPTNVEDVQEACTLLKEGNVVMTVLSGISDRNARLRYLDYLSGCCKGCDAEFREIVKVDSVDAVLIASPRGIGVKFPMAAAVAEAQAQAAQQTASNVNTAATYSKDYTAANEFKFKF